MGLTQKQIEHEDSPLVGRYWHELNDEEIQKLFDAKVTYGWIAENMRQPDWCKYPNALEWTGCWSLTETNLRKKISPEFCKDCEYYRKNYRIAQ